MTIQNCRHKTLLLLDSKNHKLRCLHCHLTIEENELTDGCCPECYEVDGVKRSDFEDFSSGQKSKAQYCCDRCGVPIPG